MKERRYSHVTTDDPGISRRIQIATYNSAWPMLFERQAARIRDALKEAALRIEHVGSTSVPGLTAKPVIDIHLAVQDSADENAYGPPLEKAGFRLIVASRIGSNIGCMWTSIPKLISTSSPKDVPNSHGAGCSAIGFGSIRRTACYTVKSSRPALREWDHVNDYADAKRDIINEIMARAEEWNRRGCIT